MHRVPVRRVSEQPETKKRREIPVEEYAPTKDGSRYFIWFIALISVIILFFALSLLFSGARVTVTPRSGEFDLDQTFTARKGASEGELSFDVMAVSGEESTMVASSDTKDIERKAKGTVIIYNAYSSKAQRLLIETRLETPDGKIYKTDKALVVPGAKVEDGETVPGSVEVTVTASEPGEEYNIGLTDFTIVGFKGTPKYDKFYARSKTEMTGGLIGKMYTISQEEGEKQKGMLREKLKQSLSSKIFAELPSGFVTYPDTIYQVDESTDFFESEQEAILIEEKGTLYSFIFQKDKLARAIAYSVVSQYEGEPVEVTNIDDLTFMLLEKEDIDPEAVDEISFTLSGNPRIVWKIDKEKLKSDLVEVHKKSFQTVLSAYENIEKAEVVIKPFWKRTFPERTKDIKINEIRPY